MMKFLMPVLLVFTGAASLFSPLFADGECGVNPVTFVPSKCQAPYEAPANQPTATCTKESDGACFSMDCDSVVWSNGVPGKCGQATITENNVPRCLSAFAVTNVTIREYATECTLSGTTCTCQLIATGVTDLVPVCNCKDLEPLH